MGLITPKRVAPVLVEPHFQLNSPNQTFVLEYLIYNIVAGISITSKNSLLFGLQNFYFFIKSISTFAISYFICKIGGIGRHAGFRHQCRKVCGFKSHILYHVLRHTDNTVVSPVYTMDTIQQT